MTYLISGEFSKSYNNQHFWSKTVCFIGFLYLFILIVPFFLSFVVDGFWKKSNYYYEQPYIDFQGDHLLQCFKGTQEIITTTIEKLDSFINTPDDKTQLQIKVSRVDNNYDQKYEFFNIYVKIIAATTTAPPALFSWECSLYLISNFGLRERINLQMQAPIHFRLSRDNTNAKPLHLVGDIEFVQKNPLQSSKIPRNNYNYTIPIVSPTQNYVSLTDFLYDTNTRNDTLRANYKTTYDTSSADEDRDQLSANIFLKVPVLIPIQYAPTLRENLKMIWQYYIYLLIPIYWIVSFLILFALQNNIFKCSVSNDLPLRPQHDNR